MFVPKTFMQFGKKYICSKKFCNLVKNIFAPKTFCNLVKKYICSKNFLQFGKKYICSKILQFGKNIFVPKLFLIYSYSFEEYGVNVQGFF